MEIRIGCSGWFYWHWRGRFYPEDLGTHRWFKHYRRRFNTVELNAPFYRWPTPSTVKQWKRQATANFRYAIKVNRLITHEKRCRGVIKLSREFCSLAETLGTNFGCFLFQFPPSFRYTRTQLRNVLRTLAAYPPGRHAVEFRHKSWWNPDVFRAFRENNIIFCSISAPRLPDELVQTTNELYIRFHGTRRWYRHDYSRDELQLWAERIRKTNASTAWIYFNNDFGAFAIKNARALRTLLR